MLINYNIFSLSWLRLIILFDKVYEVFLSLCLHIILPISLLRLDNMLNLESLIGPPECQVLLVGRPGPSWSPWSVDGPGQVVQGRGDEESGGEREAFHSIDELDDLAPAALEGVPVCVEGWLDACAAAGAFIGTASACSRAPNTG